MPDEAEVIAAAALAQQAIVELARALDQFAEMLKQRTTDDTPQVN